MFSELAYSVLLQYRWPGNVRELKNVIERVMVASQGDIILADNLLYYGLSNAKTDFSVNSESEPFSLKDKLEQLEYAYIKEAYRICGNVRKAADFLGMSMPAYVRKREVCMLSAMVQGNAQKMKCLLHK